MEEAQRLADRVAIIRGGEIVAEGPPGELGGRDAAATEIRFRLPGGAPVELPLAIAGDAEVADGMVSLRSADPVKALNALTEWALERDIEISELEVRRPSLEDVYLELTEPSERGRMSGLGLRSTSSASTRRSSGATRRRSSSR